MQKIRLILALIFIIPTVNYAQELSKFGDVSKEELALKECAFDKDANAIVFLHEAVSDYDNTGALITIHHIRLKILKESGLDEANIEIPFYRKNDFEYIDKVEGLTINATADGNMTKDKLDKSTVYSKEIDKRFGEVFFAFPSVKVGSILEYKYRSTMKHYGGLDDWDFQGELPVVLSKYYLVILPGLEFAYLVNKRPDLAVVAKPVPDKGAIYFEMQNVPGLRREPYMDARKDYLQKVTFQLSKYKKSGSEEGYMSSWSEVNKQLMFDPVFGEQLKKNIHADELEPLLSSARSPQEKMKIVYDFVRGNMIWNRIHSKYSIDGVKEAWRKKTGTSGDINLLLVNMLQDAGLRAYPMLVSERAHGRINADYPFIDQFNSVYACVTIDSRNYYLDATDPYCPAHITPYDILNTTAFIVNKNSGELINIKNDSLQYTETIISNMDVKEDGSMKGTISVQSEDYARMERLQNAAEDKEKTKNSYFHIEGFPMEITDFKIKNKENDSLALEQEFEFAGQLNSSGDYKLVPLNFIPGFSKNPFISDHRFSNINFGYRRTFKLTSSIQLPDGLVPDNLPKAVRMTTPDNSFLFTRKLAYDSAFHIIDCNIYLAFNKSLFDAGDYDTLREVYKNIFAYLKEPILLKKR